MSISLFYCCERVFIHNRYNEALLPENKDFYSRLNMEDITDTDYMYAKRVCKAFKTKHLGEYHDLYVQSNTLFLADACKDFKTKHLGEYYNLYAQSNTLFLADAFENFENMCLEIYELVPARFFIAPGLALPAALKILK